MRAFLSPGERRDLAELEAYPRERELLVELIERFDARRVEDPTYEDYWRRLHGGPDRGDGPAAPQVDPVEAPAARMQGYNQRGRLF